MQGDCGWSVNVGVGAQMSAGNGTLEGRGRVAGVSLDAGVRLGRAEWRRSVPRLIQPVDHPASGRRHLVRLSTAIYSDTDADLPRCLRALRLPLEWIKARAPTCPTYEPRTSLPLPGFSTAFALAAYWRVATSSSPLLFPILLPALPGRI